jgi:hypothetical protein
MGFDVIGVGRLDRVKFRSRTLCRRGTDALAYYRRDGFSELKASPTVFGRIPACAICGMSHTPHGRFTADTFTCASRIDRIDPDR